jgi:acyl-homoserine-lactone acylase
VNNKNKKICSVMLIVGLAACGSDNKKKASVNTIPAPVVSPAPAVSPGESALVAFDPDGTLDANIKWTSYGVPHITADNLQSLGFGSGYAYAKDNICILADQLVKIRSERAKYFGPDKVIGSGDSANIISDFGHHALGVLKSATELYPTTSENTRALLEGYSVGYNQYLTDIGIENLAPECVGQPWVKKMTPQELLAYIFATSQMASGANFLDIAFFANPGEGTEYLPYVGARSETTSKSMAANQSIAKSLLDNIELKAQSFVLPDNNHGDLGSNGWGIGKDKTENGKGTLLANPHFPHTGNLKFWQSHNTIPGVMDVTGASLQGLPGITNIGFNQNLAWTHTVSKSRRFAVYQLSLAEGNNQQYIVDGETKEIDKRTYYVEVKAGASSVMLSKDFYYSHHGLMIETPPHISNLMAWSETNAFTLRDAASENVDLIDHWLAINLASDLSEFQQAFKDHNGIPWVNTIYADDQGNAFYIDKSRVLNLNDTALGLMRTDPILVGTRQLAGFDILPGNTSIFEPDGLNNYEQAPKLLRSDFVQNSNDSYWATNPAEPLSAYSILYGDDLVALSLRTRMGLQLLNDSAGEDNKFSPTEVENALLGNRTYLGEAVLDDLLKQCQQQGSTPVSLDDGTDVDVSTGCSALASWDGKMNKESKAGHLFREFAYKFSQTSHFTTPFDVTLPATTPNSLISDGSALKAFAIAIKNVEASGFALDATIGDVQFTEKTMADGNGSGTKFPWAGSTHTEGGFNVYGSSKSNDTMYKLHQYTPVIDTETGKELSSNLTTEGYHLNYGSSWMFVVNFTDDGPVGNGLLTSSQSADSSDSSVHFDDQNRYYSENTALRPILFNEPDISNDIKAEMNISSN